MGRSGRASSHFDKRQLDVKELHKEMEERLNKMKGELIG